MDRLLARGHPDGPRLDKMWREIEPKVAREPAPRTRLRWLFLAALPIAAGLSFFFIDPPTDFVARGTGGPPRIESTCGSPDNRCRVGQPVHLRLGPGHGTATLVLVGPSPKTLGEPITLNPEQATPIGIELIPEHTDIAHGIILEVLVGEARSRTVLRVAP